MTIEDLALYFTKGLGSRGAAHLVDHFGSAERIYEASLSELINDAGLRPEIAKRIVAHEGMREAEQEIKYCQRHDIRIISATDKEYPEALRATIDRPHILFVMGNVEALGKQCLAMVGTREITPSGIHSANILIKDLGEQVDNLCIVSGLAYGIDICAHRTALDNGLPTIGVMATGPETVYPYRHKEFAERLWQTPGCALVTDYPPGTAPLAIHFLRRNRIIAGLADATILIESKSRGGGMTTSRLAFSYSRDVYALPGRADDVRSQGCNRLIREKIAEPLISIEDLIGSLGLEKRSGNRKISPVEILKQHLGKQCSSEQIEDMGKILYTIRNERGITTEEIALKTGMDYMKVSRITGFLEMEGLICIDLLQRCTLETKIFR